MLVIKDDLKVPTMILCMEVGRLFKWKDMTQQERISILHYKNGSKMTDYDARNETPESLDRIQDTLLNDSRSFYVMLKKLHDNEYYKIISSYS